MQLQRSADTVGTFLRRGVYKALTKLSMHLNSGWVAVVHLCKKFAAPPVGGIVKKEVLKCDFS